MVQSTAVVPLPAHRHTWRYTWLHVRSAGRRGRQQRPWWVQHWPNSCYSGFVTEDRFMAHPHFLRSLTRQVPFQDSGEIGHWERSEHLVCFRFQCNCWLLAKRAKPTFGIHSKSCVFNWSRKISSRNPIWSQVPLFRSSECARWIAFS